MMARKIHVCWCPHLRSIRTGERSCHPVEKRLIEPTSSLVYPIPASPGRSFTTYFVLKGTRQGAEVILEGRLVAGIGLTWQAWLGDDEIDPRLKNHC